MVVSHYLCQLVHAVLHFIQMLVCIPQNVLGGPIGRVYGNLGDEPHALAAENADAAVIGVELACQNAKQCGFAAAVAAQNPNTFAVVDLKGQTVQYVFVLFKGLDQSLHRNIDHVFSLISLYLATAACSTLLAMEPATDKPPPPRSTCTTKA